MSESQSLSRSRPRAWSSTDLIMLLVVLIWGINFTVVKTALSEFWPLAFNAIRFTLATLVMLAVLRWRGESLRVSRADILPVIALGLVGHTIYQVCFINGLARTTPANASLLMATSPIFVVIYGRVLGVERTNRLVWAGIGLSFVGILLLVLGGGGNLGLGGTWSAMVGDLLVLVAAMLWAAYTTGSKPVLARYSPVKLTTLTMLYGTVPLVLISVPQLVRQNWNLVSPGAWAGLLYSAVLSVAVGYVGWYTSVRRVGNARTAIYSNLTPVVAVLVAWVALGDRLAPLEIVGAAVVLGGLLLTRRGRAG